MMQDKCPKCKSDRIIFDAIRGEIVCTQCGHVISTMIDTGAEWRAFSQEEMEKKARTGLGISPSLQKIQMPTFIDESTKDATHRTLTAKQRRQAKKLIRAQIFATMTPKDKPLYTARDLLQTKKLKLKFSDEIFNETIELFKKAFEKGLLRSCSTEAILDACLYYVCKDKLGLTRKEIASASSRKLKEIDKAYRLLVFNKVIRSKPTPLRVIVCRFAKQLGFPTISIECGMELADMVEEARLHVGRDPRSLVGAILYLIPQIVPMQWKITFQEIAKLLQTTEVTIRDRYELIMRELGHKIGAVDRIRRAYVVKSRSTPLRDVVCKYAKKLKYPPIFIECGTELADLVEANLPIGKDRKSFVGAILYLVPQIVPIQWEVSLQEIAQVLQIKSIEKIKDRYELIIENLGQEIGIDRNRGA